MLLLLHQGRPFDIDSSQLLCMKGSGRFCVISKVFLTGTWTLTALFAVFDFLSKHFIFDWIVFAMKSGIVYETRALLYFQVVYVIEHDFSNPFIQEHLHLAFDNVQLVKVEIASSDELTRKRSRKRKSVRREEQVRLLELQRLFLL